MHEILNEYRPDFTPASWSERDRHFLSAFASNPDGIVSVLRNLPPEITGALCSRASRAPGSLFEVLLKEYIYPIVNGDDTRLAAELEDTVRFLKDHGFKHILNNQRAQAFYSKWLSQYGDDSIAQVTGTHIIVWGMSQVAMKFVEDQRIGLEPIEKSKTLNNSDQRDLFARYLLKRSARWQKVGRALENAYLRFEIIMDIGSYRDLHRHRMMTQERQNFSTFHGYSVPSEIDYAGLAPRFEK